MKNENPELVVLSCATSAIKGMKDSPFAYDGIPQPAHYIPASACDCDE